MNKGYIEQIEDIKHDVYKICNKITTELAKEATYDMVSTARAIIDDFYQSYDPKYYVRTHNLYNMILQKPVYEYSGNAHIASISTLSLNMFDNYNISPNTVYDLMWNTGHRGLPYQSLPSWYPSINYLGGQYDSNTPHNTMKLFVDRWGDNIGKQKVKNIVNKQKKNWR